MRSLRCFVFWLNGRQAFGQVQADSLCEAATEGIRVISDRWGKEPALLTRIVIEAKPLPVTHELTLHQIRSRLEIGSASPQDKLNKQRLKERMHLLVRAFVRTQRS